MLRGRTSSKDRCGHVRGRAGRSAAAATPLRCALRAALGSRRRETPIWRRDNPGSSRFAPPPARSTTVPRCPLAAFVCLAALTAGCAAVPGEPPPLDGTAWVLSARPGGGASAGASATLRFEGGQALGSDGCNRFFGPYRRSGATLEIGPHLAGTQMACEAAVMKRAEAFRAALAAARSYRLAEGSLQLLGADGAPLATLAPQSTALAGTAWRVTGINNGKGAVVGVRAGSTVTMQFDDARAAGSAGCNRYSSGYERNGSNLRFGPPAASRRACVEEGVMEQERLFLDALPTVATMRVEGDRLELRRADGALALALTRDSR